MTRLKKLINTKIRNPLRTLFAIGNENKSRTQSRNFLKFTGLSSIMSCQNWGCMINIAKVNK